MTDNKASTPLWGTGDERAQDAVDARIRAFCAADDARLDNQLLEDDLVCSAAHVRGLGRIGVLTVDEVGQLTGALDALRTQAAAGAFVVGPEDEDGHSAIERALTEQLGDVGRKVHTGRSRNDQVLVATRHHLKRRLAALAAQTRAAARIALDRAQAEGDQPLPGFTHLQRAVPSTVGFWFAGHAESLAEDALGIDHAIALLDANPLGTAAGYGVNLPLDRAGATEELGFGRTLINGLCAQNGRGKIEAHALGAVLLLMASARRLAWDLSLFTTAEFQFVVLPKRWCTGSSIMPNKLNPDVAELMRAAFATVAAAQSELMLVTALPSGYQRDLQGTKAPLMRALATADHIAALIGPLLAELTFDEARCAEAFDAAMLATDKAVSLAADGVPFRDAYRQVKQQLADLEEGDLLEAVRASIVARTSPGGPGDLQLDAIRSLVEGGHAGG
jgi:argininosuccinate lyase